MVVALCAATPALSDELVSPSIPSASNTALAPVSPPVLTPFPRAQNDQEAADQFILAQGEILEQVYELDRQLQERLEVRRAELGDEEYTRLIRDGKKKETFRVNIAGIGFAEPTTIDGVIVSRIVQESTGISFLLLDERVSPESRHLRRYIARQHRLAGEHGRHLVILRLEREVNEDEAILETTTTQFLPKPTSHSERFRELVDDIAQPVTAGDVKLAAFCSALQAGISCAMEGLHMLADSGHQFDYRPAALSVAFGMVVGSLSGTWKNFSSTPKDPAVRTRRSMALSLSFNYMLSIWKHGVGGLIFNMQDVTGLLAATSLAQVAGSHGALVVSEHFRAIANGYINNRTKDFWGAFLRIRENMGLSRGGYVWGRNEDEGGVRRTVYEYQMLNFGPYTIKMFDLVNFGVTVPMLGTLGLGKLIFYSSYAWVQYARLRYAEALGYEEAPQMRREWEDFKRGRFLTTPLRQWSHRAYNVVRGALLRARPSSCESAMLPENTTDGSASNVPERELRNPQDAA